MKTIFMLALRNLGRNKRRSFFSALALSIGVGLLFLITGFLNGEVESAIRQTINLQTGHIQLQALNYNPSRTSLKREDLINDPLSVAAAIQKDPRVLSATPKLLLTGILNQKDETASVRIIGIELESEANKFFKSGLLEGTYLTDEDRGGVLVGKPLAEKFKLKPGSSLQLLVNNSEGNITQQTFEVRGVYSTNVQAFDKFYVLMPLSKAQSIGGAEDHASYIYVLLKDINDTQSVKSALANPTYKIQDWRDMNELLILFEDVAADYFGILYIIVLGITATVVMNTQLMAVYERTIEIGILTSLGMKSKAILAVFLVEALYLAIAGVIMGIVLGWISVELFAINGFNISEMGIDMMMSNTIYPYLVGSNYIELSIYGLVVTVLAGVYPALLAAKLEPVEALHGSI